VAHQFLRCVLHQLAPNGVFVQMFQTHADGKTDTENFLNRKFVHSSSYENKSESRKMGSRLRPQVIKKERKRGGDPIWWVP
jgi:hypothetical protein